MVYLVTIPCRTNDCPVYTVPIPEVQMETLVLSRTSSSPILTVEQ